MVPARRWRAEMGRPLVSVGLVLGASAAVGVLAFEAAMWQLLTRTAGGTSGPRSGHYSIRRSREGTVPLRSWA